MPSINSLHFRWNKLSKRFVKLRHIAILMKSFRSTALHRQKHFPRRLARLLGLRIWEYSQYKGTWMAYLGNIRRRNPTQIIMMFIFEAKSFSLYKWSILFWFKKNFLTDKERQAGKLSYELIGNSSQVSRPVVRNLIKPVHISNWQPQNVFLPRRWFFKVPDT